MSIRVLFFSVLRDLAGTSEVIFPLEKPVSVKELCDELFLSYPLLAPWQPSLLVAVNESYVKMDHVLVDGDEVAMMPPVQGG